MNLDPGRNEDCTDQRKTATASLLAGTTFESSNGTAATAADLTLLDAGKTDYQIVLPDAAPSPALHASLQQTARLLQTAFLANKVEIAIVREKERDGSKLALMLGNTVLARKNGVEVTKLGIGAMCSGWLGGM